MVIIHVDARYIVDHRSCKYHNLLAYIVHELLKLDELVGFQTHNTDCKTTFPYKLKLLVQVLALILVAFLTSNFIQTSTYRIKNNV